MTPSKRRGRHEHIGHLLDKAHDLKKTRRGGEQAKRYKKLAEEWKARIRAADGTALSALAARALAAESAAEVRALDGAVA